MTRTRARAVAVVAAVVLLTAPACGGGSDTPTAVEDKATAERIVLVSFDLPGYTVEPEDDTDDDPNHLDQCMKDSPLVGNDFPRGVDGAAFTKDDDNVRVQSSAALAEKESEAKEAFSEIKAALSSQCVRDGMKKNFEESALPGVRVQDVVTSALPGLEITDDFVATRLTVPVERDDDEFSLFMDMTFLRQGRTLAGMLTFQGGSPFPDAERVRLATLLGERMNGKGMNFPDSTPGSTAPRASTTVPRSPTTGGGSASGYSTFDDPSGASLEHPSSWTVEPSTADRPLVLFIDPPGEGPFRRNINIMRQSGPAPGPSTSTRSST